MFARMVSLKPSFAIWVLVGFLSPVLADLFSSWAFIPSSFSLTSSGTVQFSRTYAIAFFWVILVIVSPFTFLFSSLRWLKRILTFFFFSLPYIYIITNFFIIINLKSFAPREEDCFLFFFLFPYLVYILYNIFYKKSIKACSNFVYEITTCGERRERCGICDHWTWSQSVFQG